MLASAVDVFMIALAWTFVISRIVHAVIHTTYNHVPHRFLVYLFGSIVVAVMWVLLFLHVASAGV